jgi:hypothetical protein
MGACAGALPALVAAGAPLDAVLGDDFEDAPLQQFLQDHGGQSIQRPAIWEACSALALAARCVGSGSCLQHPASTRSPLRNMAQHTMRSVFCSPPC